MKRTDAKRSHGVLPPIAVRRFMALVLALLMLVPADLASVLAEGTRSSGKKLICGLEEHQHNKA